MRVLSGFVSSSAPLLLLLATVPAIAAKRDFSIGPNDAFHLDGHPFQLRAGALHYWRIPEAYWRDRLDRAKALGMNAVQFYIPWWLAEEELAMRERGHIEQTFYLKFLDLLQEMDLLVVLRPGPYVCGELDAGGLPPRIARMPKLRTFDEAYVQEVGRFWDALLPEINDRLYVNGGTVLMVQLENEFASYGNTDAHPEDRKYLEFLLHKAQQHLRVARSVREDGLFDAYFTTDPWGAGTGGGLDSVYRVVDFEVGRDIPRYFETERRQNHAARRPSPVWVSEVYPGWMTAWGDARYGTRGATEFAEGLQRIVGSTPSSSADAAGHTVSDRPANAEAEGAKPPNGSFSLYMLHGGTNFAFSNGANTVGDGFQPQVTTYDYNAPVAEDGRHNYGSDGRDKFAAIRDVLARTAADGREFPVEPPLLRIGSYGKIGLGTKKSYLASIVRNNDAARDAQRCAEFEPTPASDGRLRIDPSQLDRFDHLNLVRFVSDAPLALTATLSNVKDVLYVFNRETRLADIYRRGLNGERDGAHRVEISTGEHGANYVDFLLENAGRENFSREMPHDQKGFEFDSGDRAALRGKWFICDAFAPESVVDFEKNARVVQGNDERAASNEEAGLVGPAVYEGNLHIASRDELQDTHLDFSDEKFGKGFVVVNGKYNLGRYWSLGPVFSLYLPAAFLRVGDNRIQVIEFHPPHLDAEREITELNTIRNPSYMHPLSAQLDSELVSQ